MAEVIQANSPADINSRMESMGLHDDKADKTSDFGGATLELDAESKDTLPEVDFHSPGAANIRRDRPFSASTASRKSATSATSQTSLSTSVVQNDYTVKSYFCFRVYLDYIIFTGVSYCLCFFIIFLLSLLCDVCLSLCPILLLSAGGTFPAHIVLSNRS